MYKMDRRIHRFITKLSNARSALFIRTEGSFEEIRTLKRILSQYGSGEFHILVVNYSTDSTISEQAWGIPGVCSVLIPKGAEWWGCTQSWDFLLNGITTTGGIDDE
jgi:hypothetical protein